MHRRLGQDIRRRRVALEISFADDPVCVLRYREHRLITILEIVILSCAPRVFGRAKGLGQAKIHTWKDFAVPQGMVDTLYIARAQWKLIGMRHG